MRIRRTTKDWWIVGGTFAQIKKKNLVLPNQKSTLRCQAFQELNRRCCVRPGFRTLHPFTHSAVCHTILCTLQW